MCLEPADKMRKQLTVVFTSVGDVWMGPSDQESSTLEGGGEAIWWLRETYEIGSREGMST